MTQKIELYTMNYCPFCVRAKALLNSRGVVFTEILVAEDDDKKWDELYQRSKMRTMPQIYVDGKILGGFNELNSLDQSDKLESLK